MIVPLALRGGATVADYSGAAAELFNNMRAPAALIGGSIVPIGFAAVPEPALGDTPLVRTLKQVHMIVAIGALCSEIIAVIYSTIAINKLSETVVAPAASVMDLLSRDYETAWLGCNINFLLGMFGFTLLLGLRAWFSFGDKLGKVGMLLVTSVLCHSLSIVNKGIQIGDGSGGGFANSFFGLCLRYGALLFSEKSVMSTLSVVFLLIAVVFFGKAKTA